MNRPIPVAVVLALVWSLTIPAWSGSAPRRMIFPIVANGGEIEDGSHFQSNFTFVNLSNTTVQASLGVYDDNGRLRTDFLLCTPVPRPTQVIEFSLGSGGLAHTLAITALPLLQGWGEVQVEGGLAASVEVARLTDEPVECGLICNRSSEVILTSTQFPAVEPDRNFQAAAIITRFRQTAFAIVNPSETETAAVTIRLRDSMGGDYFVPAGESQRRAEATYQIPPRSRSTGFIWDLLFRPAGFEDPPSLGSPPPPPLPESFHGSAVFESDHPVAVGGVNVVLPQGKLVAAEVVAAPAEIP